MKIVHGNAARPPSERRATVTGEAWFEPLLPATDGVTVATVFFAPGAHTYWHTHEHGQLLQVVAGQGLICTAGESPQVISAGDSVWVPPGERHWHGAAPEHFMTHIAIWETPESGDETTWGDLVGDDEYVARG